MHYSLTRATLWNLSGYLYLFFAAFISTPIILRYLGVSGFATYSLIIGTTILVSSLDFGLPGAVVRALVLERSNTKKRFTLWSTSLILFFASGILSVIFTTFISVAFRIPSNLYHLIFLLCLINNLLSHFLTLPQSEGHFGYYNAKTFIVGTGNTIASALAAYLGFNLSGILLVMLTSYVLSLLPLLYFTHLFFPLPWRLSFSINDARSLLNFGLKNQFGKIVGQVQSQYAKYLLSASSSFALSAFVIAQSLVQKAAGGVSQLSSALYPAATTRIVRTLYHRLQLFLLTLGLVAYLLFELWGLPFLIWWLKAPELANSVNQILEILMPAFVILILTPLPSAILDAQGFPGTTALFALTTTVIEITFALLLFPRYGVLAPAYAMLWSLIITTPILLYFTENIIKFPRSS